MAECPICGEEAVEEPIEEDKLERLQEHEHLEGREIVKLVCGDCGHTAYVSKD